MERRRYQSTRATRAAVLACAALLFACAEPGAEPYVRLLEPAPAVPGVPRRPLQLISFWASWCVPCVQELPELVALARRGPDGLELVLVVDDPQAAVLRNSTEGTPLTIVGDGSGELSTRFRVDRRPSAFLAVDGTLVARLDGARDWDKPRMRALLRRLGSGASGPTR